MIIPLPLYNDYNNCRQLANESVSHYSDKFRARAEPLGYLDSNDVALCTSVKRHYVTHLSPAIRTQYNNYTATMDLQGKKESEFTLEQVIQACSRFDYSRMMDAQYEATTKPKVHDRESPSKSKSNVRTNAGSGSSSSENVKRCIHHPGKTSHTTAECKNPGTGSATSNNNWRANETTTSTAKESTPRKPNVADVTCFICHEKGHYQNQCPMNTAANSNSSKATANTTTAARPATRSQGAQLEPPSKSIRSLEINVDNGSKGENKGMGRISLTTSTDVLSLTTPSLTTDQARGVVWVEVEGYPKRLVGLVDTGAEVSSMLIDVAEEMKLATEPQAGTYTFAMNDTTCPRAPKATAIAITVHRPGLSSVKVPCRPDIAKLSAGVQFMIGQDLIDSVFPEGVPLSCIKKPKVNASDVRLAHVRLNNDMIEHSLVPSIPSEEIDDLFGVMPPNEVVESTILSTDTHLTHEYEQKRAQLLIELEPLLHANRQVTGFCTFEQSVVHIEVDPSKLGTLYRKQYPLPATVTAAVTAKVKDWYAEGRIKLAPMNCPYNSALLAVPKKDDNGNLTGIRVCLDVRPLNLALVNVDTFQLPLINEMLETFGGKSWFGEVDLAEAYLQFPLAEASQQFTAFTWNQTQYVFVGAPFGLSSLPSHFQRCMNLIFGDLSQFVTPYLDNLPFASASWEEHRDHIAAIISRCTWFNLKIKLRALKVCYSQMRCLGHVLSGSGIGIDPDKMKAVHDWPFPLSGAGMQAFLGLVTYIRRFVRHFGDLSAPLEAVKFRKVIEPTQELLDAFGYVKLALSKAPLLQYPDVTRPFFIATDASQTGIGGVLYQPDGDNEDITAGNIVAIVSHKLNETERNYSTYKKELYALIYCLKKFHGFVWGRTDLKVFTDHRPLTYLFESSTLTPSVQQWLDKVLDYSFTVHYRAGILNVLPDAVSRMYASVYDDGVWGVPLKLNNNGRKIMDSIRAINDANTTGTGSVPVSAVTTTSTTPALRNLGEGSSAPTTSLHQPTDLELLAIAKGKTIPTVGERQAILEHEHSLGHWGRDAMFKSLWYKKNMWWPNMRHDMHVLLENCSECTQYTVKRCGFHPARYITASGPWDHLQLDCSVHLPPTSDGYTTLLVIICVFSGFVLLRPLKSTKAEYVAQVLWDACATLGVPRIIQSDNGPEFSNDLLRAFTKLVGIQHRYITPYNPRADGKVERSIGAAMSVIKKLVHGKLDEWVKAVPYAQMCVNNKVTQLTGSTPFSLLFGREMNDLADQTIPSPEPITSADIQKWKEHQLKINTLIYPAVNKRVKAAKQKMVKQVDKKKHTQLVLRPLRKNTVVMIEDPNKRNKWESKYHGPYTIVRRTRMGNYRIKDALGDQVDRPFPLDQLKVLTRADRQALGKIYEVDSIIGHRGDPGAYEYLVWWQGYPKAEATWEPASNVLEHTVIKDYWASLAQPLSSSTPASTTTT